MGPYLTEFAQGANLYIFISALCLWFRMTHFEYKAKNTSRIHQIVPALHADLVTATHDLPRDRTNCECDVQKIRMHVLCCLTTALSLNLNRKVSGNKSLKATRFNLEPWKSTRGLSLTTYYKHTTSQHFSAVLPSAKSEKRTTPVNVCRFGF